MPSAITKQPLENGASLSQETSIQAALAIMEKKVRNLEKRKVSHHLVSRTARGDAGICAKIILKCYRVNSTPTETFLGEERLSMKTSSQLWINMTR